MSTKIEYVDETINPIRTKEGGWYCVKSSPGCLNCYAEKINRRFGDGKPYAKRDVELVLNENALEKPLKWKKPKRIFIQDMSDLFLPVSGEYFNRVQHQAHCRIIELIKKTPQHTYLMLTKHPKEMSLSFLGTSGLAFWREPLHFYNGEPLPNLRLGVTCENQEQADKRIPILLGIPAAVHFVSVEPMLGPVDLRQSCEAFTKDKMFFPPTPAINGVICGTESLGGRPGRAVSINTIRNLKNQCIEANIPFFLKQMPVLGIKNGLNVMLLQKMPLLDGQVWDQMPATKEAQNEAIGN